MKRVVLLFIIAVWSISIFPQKPAFPLHASENGRYLVDSNNKPFFYQAETPWNIFINLNEKEMGELMDIRIRQGFNVIQTMALKIGMDVINVNGDKPFEDNDFTRPNMAYFEHLRKGVQLAEKKGLLVGMSTAWKGCCGEGWDKIILQNGTQKCREYGRFLGKYFAGCKNLFWIQGGDIDPNEHINHYREIALGIRESMPDVLQTYHAFTGHSSSDVVNYRENSWLNFSWTYTYYHSRHNVWIYLNGWGELPEVYEMNHEEYRKYPVKPFVLGESQYEGVDSVSYKPQRASEVVRRQAYWSILSGSCGHAYGSWCWKVNEDWRKVEKDTGAWDMLNVKQLFESLDWTKLQPDIQNVLISEGAGTYGKTDYAVASISYDRRFAIIYIPPTETEERKLELNMNQLSVPVAASWYNPTNGKYIPVKKSLIPNKDKFTFITPGDNGERSNDWLLLLN